MGWLVRFIHNRDLAVENIVTAYVRQRLVLSAPPLEREDLISKIALGTLSFSPGSLLLLATDVSQSTPGTFRVLINRTKRNSRTIVESCLPQVVRRQIAALCSSASPILRAPQFALGVVQMDKGISINGRPYCAGNFCEIVSRVPRGSAAEADAPRFLSVGEIDCFFVVSCGVGYDRSDEVFISVWAVNVLEKQRSLYVRARPAEDDPKPPAKIIHVDSVVRRIHFVPHFSQAGLECGIPVWNAK